MNQAKTRRPLSSLLFVLGAAAVLGTAGCSPGGGGAPDGNVTSLSQLPHKGQSMLKLGDASRAAGDCTAALRFYHMAIEKHANPGELAAARLGSADCEIAMGNIAAAEKEYLSAAKLEPQNPAPMVGLGRVALIQHQPAQAVDYFDHAVEHGAKDAFVWNDKGVALDQLRRHRDAQEAYRRGLTNHPADRALRNNLALSLAMTGDFQEAEGLLRQLLGEPGATARTHDNLALVLGLEGNEAGAREASASDLNGAALDNNARFYAYARAQMAGASHAGAETITAAPAAAESALAAATIPPPALTTRKHLAARIKAKPAETVAALPLVPEPSLRQSDSGVTGMLAKAPPPTETAAVQAPPPAPAADTIPEPPAPPMPVASSDGP